jgi:ubiquinol-cytochrome c reductase cytochrome c subunit
LTGSIASRYEFVSSPETRGGSLAACRPWALILVVTVAAVAWRGPRAARADETSDGPAQTFRADCAVCHGGDGEGSDRGPTLRGVGRASIDYELSTGRMPLAPAGRVEEPGRAVEPLPRKLGDPAATTKRRHPAYDAAMIAGLVDYVSTLTGGGGPAIPRVVAGSVASGGELFRLQCAACHAWAGDGGALLHREAPALHAATPVQIAEAVRVGPGQMPAFGSAALTDRQLNDVVSYVRYLDHPRDRGGFALGHLGPVAEGAIALAGIGVLLLFVRWIGDRG